MMNQEGFGVVDCRFGASKVSFYSAVMQRHHEVEKGNVG